MKIGKPLRCSEQSSIGQGNGRMAASDGLIVSHAKVIIST
jgi:hypothetical protein